MVGYSDGMLLLLLPKIHIGVESFPHGIAHQSVRRAPPSLRSKLHALRSRGNGFLVCGATVGRLFSADNARADLTCSLALSGLKAALEPDAHQWSSMGAVSHCSVARC